MQELGKLNFKINVKPDGLEEYMSFRINNKLRFINSIQFLSSSLDSLVKKLILSILIKKLIETYYIYLSKKDFILMNERFSKV